jgi:hypothetical protein
MDEKRKVAKRLKRQKATPPKRADAKPQKAVAAARDGALRQVIGYVRRHPVASVTIVVAAGALVTFGIRTGSLPRRRFAGTGTPFTGLRAMLAPPALLKRPAQPLRRIGVAGMEVATSGAHGANRTFRLNWKRRPADAPDENWPTDQVELRNKRADGGRTDFRLTWKTLPPQAPIAPERYPGDAPFGATAIELETTRPDGRTTGIGFKWRKLSPEEQTPDATPDVTPDAAQSA